MQKSADEAMAAISVVITAARPVAVVREKLEHQIEQLHGFADVWASGIGSIAPGLGIRVKSNYHRRPHPAPPLCY